MIYFISGIISGIIFSIINQRQIDEALPTEAIQPHHIYHNYQEALQYWQWRLRFVGGISENQTIDRINYEPSHGILMVYLGARNDARVFLINRNDDPQVIPIIGAVQEISIEQALHYLESSEERD
jgi:hypothetical protein